MSKEGRKLSDVEIERLLVHVVDNSESWDNYQRFCVEWDIEEERQFTPGYWKRWIQRHRTKIQERREIRNRAIQRGSSVTREVRLMTLEASLAAITKELETTLKSDMREVLDVTRLTEMQRKLLEQIAKERGEWDVRGSRDDDDEKQDVSKARAAVIEHMKEQARIEAAKDVTPE